VQGVLEKRSLLGHAQIVVLDTVAWRAVLNEVVGWRFIKTVVNFYDNMLLYGFGSARKNNVGGSETLPRAKKGKGEKRNGTAKKERVIVNAHRLVFSELLLASNRKRMWNGRTAEKKPKDRLLTLLEACEKH
jgi:hypothetical protein